MLKPFKFVLGALGLVAAAASFAQTNRPAEISPASGTLLDNQKFDLLINLPGAIIDPYLAADYLKSTMFISAKVDGIDQTPAFKNCLIPMKAKADGGLSLVCPNQTASLFGTAGTHVLDITVTPFIKDGITYTGRAEYRLVSALKYIALPYKVTVPASSPVTATGIYLTPGDSVSITATGYATIMPGTGGFPLAGPRGGSVNCATNSTCLLPGAPVGMLLYRVGVTGPWKPYTADKLQIQFTQPGELFFSINDKAAPEFWTDNAGSFDVNLSGYLSNKPTL